MTNDSKLASAVKSIIQLDSNAQRQRAIDTTCGTNRSLRSRLQMIIDALPPEEDAAKDVSILHSLDRTMATPRVVLDDSIHESSEPMLQPTSAEMPAVKPESRYQVQGEIARGGIGAILKGRDVDLGRNLAIKVLLDAHKDKPKIIQRFIEEAQIGGQLQHPGIAPVYELGQFEDQRPFFTMKLIKGETLAFLLSTRRTVAHNRATLIGHFEQVCQTVAYAHSRRVIHRDLKPANIMIGDFGEVQVMDWGLAKVIPKTGSKESIAETEIADRNSDARSVIQTLRSTGEDVPLGTLQPEQVVGSQTQFGHAIGSPAYMPPEQALGQVDSMDERSDVFGLGAILCEILTGDPPYLGATLTEVLKLAARAQLDDCHRRLDDCGADPTLIETAKRCLSPKMTDRPSNAGEVSQRVTEHLESVQSQLRDAEVMRAKELACAQEARKRRRTTVFLSCIILIIVTASGASWLSVRQRESERRALVLADFQGIVQEAKLQKTLAESTVLSERASKYAEARFHIQNALAFADANRIESDHRANVEALEKDLTQAIEQTRRGIRQTESDTHLKEQLELIRELHASGSDDSKLHQLPDTFRTYTRGRFDAVLARAGFDVEASANKTAMLIRQSQIHDELVTALDFWMLTEEANFVETQSPRAREVREQLNEILSQADQDTWRRSVRKALMDGNSSRLNDWMEKDRVAAQSTSNIVWCAVVLNAAGHIDLATTILSQAQRSHPGDYPLNLAFAKCLDETTPREAITFARAALAKRPSSNSAQWNLTISLAKAGQADAATTMLETLIVHGGLSVDDCIGMTLSLLAREYYELASITVGAAMKLEDGNREAISLNGFIAEQLDGTRAISGARPDQHASDETKRTVH